MKILLVALVASTLGFAAMLGVAEIAYADGQADAAPAAEPAPDPVEDASLVYRMWKSGALVPAIILAVFFALRLAAAKVKRLQSGKVALYVTAGLAGLGMLAEAAMNGTTPNLGMWLAAIGTVLSLAANPQPKPPLKSVP